MYKHILVPTDGTPLSLKAATEAVGLAKRLGSTITAVFVTSPWMPPMISEGSMVPRLDQLQEHYAKTQEAAARTALAHIEDVAKAAGIAVDGVHVIDNQPWDGILTAAKDKSCDLIVMASHGRKGMAGLLLGSETVKVLTHSKIPVLVCR
jgi:nucleotide-binding universal stress UspA family protein